MQETDISNSDPIDITSPHFATQWHNKFVAQRDEINKEIQEHKAMLKKSEKQIKSIRRRGGLSGWKEWNESKSCAETELLKLKRKREDDLMDYLHKLISSVHDRRM